MKQIIGNFAINYNERVGVKWGIERKGIDGIIGTIGFQEWSHEHMRADISYALSPEHWGNGYLGFINEGVLRNYMYQDGVPYDTNIYSLLDSKS